MESREKDCKWKMILRKRYVDEKKDRKKEID